MVFGMKAFDWYRSAELLFANLEPGGHVFAFSHGQLAMGDLVVAAHAWVSNREPVEGISIFTFSASADAEVAMRRALSLSCRTMRLVVSINAAANKKYKPEAWLALRPDLDLRLAYNHAKIARVWGKSLHVCIRGSGNMGQASKNCEQWDIWEGIDEAWAEIEKIEETFGEKYTAGKSANSQAYRASGVGLSGGKADMARKLGIKSLKVR